MTVTDIMTDIFANPRPLHELAEYLARVGEPVHVCVLDPQDAGIALRYANVSLTPDGWPLLVWDHAAAAHYSDPLDAERAARAPIVWQSWPETDGPLVAPIDALAILSALRRFSCAH